MKTKLVITLLAVAMVFLAAWTGVGQRQRAPRVLYEYQVLDDFANNLGAEQGLKKLNELGTEGWEVVAVTTESQNYPPKIWLKRVKR